MATVDPTVYHDTGKYLTDLAARLGEANTDLVGGLSGCGGMAGNYDDARRWAQSYDQSADSVVDSTRALADTLEHFGSLLSWAGYNHQLANYNSNISTSKGAHPPAPVSGPAAALCYVDSPTAFGGSGSGLETDIPNLLEDIGIPVPNGDTDLLDTAAAAWHTFITSDAVEDAMNLSLLGVFRFQHLDSPEIPDIQDHLNTLAGCAINIQDTGNRLRQACSDHSSGLTQLRNTLHDLLRDLDIQLGLTLAITIFSTFLSAGTSSTVGTAAATTEIAATASRMAAAIRDLNIVERIAQAFKDVRDLSLAKTKTLLSSIRDLKKTSAVEEDIVPPEEAAEEVNADNARTAESVKKKLNDYLLNPDHPTGGPKAKWFQQALGFTRSNADQLAAQVVFNPSTATETDVTQYGTKYNQIISILGANGKTIDVQFAWIRNNDGIFRLVTAIPTPK